MSDVQPVTAGHFIVKYLGKYYLTQEVWEFDPSADPGSLQADQAFWLKQIQSLYLGGVDKADGAVHVAGGKVGEASQIDDGGGSTPGKP